MKNVSCGCLEKLIKRVQEIDPEHGELETVQKCSVITGKTWCAFPPIYFKARNKNKAGKLTGRATRHHFNTPFCPMCGKPN